MNFYYQADVIDMSWLRSASLTQVKRKSSLSFLHSMKYLNHVYIFQFSELELEMVHRLSFVYIMHIVFIGKLDQVRSR